MQSRSSFGGRRRVQRVFDAGATSSSAGISWADAHDHASDSSEMQHQF